MNRIFLVCCVTLLLISLPLSLISMPADFDNSSRERYLNIATIDSRPISNDKLLYLAFKEINCRATFTTTLLQTGYSLANSGDKDGVIASTPNIEQAYPNLIKVNVPLEQIHLCAFIRKDSNLKINNWNDLSGYTVGINTQRPYINSKLPDSLTIIEKDTAAQVMKGLIAGEYDVAILSHRVHETLRLPDNVSQAGILGELTDYLYLNKKHEYLIPMITEEINNIFADGRGEKILNDVKMPEINQKKNILHIVSSNMEIEREEQFNTKLKEHFENDMSIEWYTIALNSRRFSRDTGRLIYFANLLRQDFVSKNVAAIIVSGDDAMDFLQDYYYLFFRNTPVLFYGVNGDYSAKFPDYNRFFTGITKQIPVYETVSMGLKLFPNTKNIYVVNDYTTEGQYYKEAVKNQLNPLSNTLNIEYNENVSIDLLLENIKKLPKDSLVFVGSYFCDANGQYFPLKEMKRLLERDCNVPVLAIHSTNVDYNSVGGKSLDYAKMGTIVAEMLARILNGENIENILAINSSENYSSWVFDQNVMNKLGVKEKNLPKGSLVLNKIPSIWESDPRFAVTLVALLIISVIAVISVGVFVISYRKQQELLTKDAKIREVKERMERIVSTSPVSYLMCVNSFVVEINTNMKNDTGLGVGSHISTIYANLEERSALLERLKSEGFVKNEVVKIRFKDGSIHRCLLNIALTDYEGQKAMVVWVVDIEESELHKDELRFTRQNLQTVLDFLPVPTRILDVESNTVLYANKASAKLFGVSSYKEILGRTVEDFLPLTQPDGTNSFEKINRLYQFTEPVSAEMMYLRNSGEPFEVLITVCQIEYNGKKAALSVMKDLAEEKEYQRMLFSTAEKEKEANLLKSRFLVNMSHEIRTPMNAIIGLAEIELRKELPPETKEIYKKINISAKNLLEIINDILDMSKIEADKVELFESEFELEEVLNSSLLVASPRLDGKNVEFMLNTSLDLPRFIVGDKTRLWQILKNFLDNSAKYTENGKVVLTVFAANEQPDDENITITFIIEDTGIGISEEKMQKLFMPYEQIYNEAQKKYSGTGLGMTISKQLCELMGGKIKVESRLNEGTTIHLNIPFKRSQNNETEMQAVKVPALTGIEVLAVDDDELSLDIMSRILKGNDTNYTLAKSGTQAMEIILNKRDKGEFFDIILLDYMMEELNGLETAKQIHLALSKAPKLLMVTAYQKLLLKSQLEASGIDDIIEKPFIPSQFIKKLCMTLGYEDSIAEEPMEVFTRFKDVHVLLCEDYHLNQEVATGMFAQFGITATIAENGKEGIKILNSGKKFDLIFMDLQMPVMDGYEATRIIRSNPSFDNIPVISLTADAMKEIVERCLEMGMNDHVAKPIEFSSLNRVFQKWLPESKRVFGDEMKLPLLDQVDEVLGRFGGSKELYEKALLEFAQFLPEKWQDFNVAVENKEETGKYIHKLKGAAGNLSENDIYKCAAEFETSLRTLKPDKALYEKLVNVCNIVKKRIAEQMKETGVISQEIGTVEEFTNHLNNLKEALQNYNPKDSSKTIKSLKEKTWPLADTSKLQQLYEFTQKYEFDAALDILNSMVVKEK